MLKRLTITGSTLRIRSNDVKGGIARALEEKSFRSSRRDRSRFLSTARFR